jgi:hypothetical protein
MIGTRGLLNPNIATQNKNQAKTMEHRLAIDSMVSDRLLPCSAASVEH